MATIRKRGNSYQIRVSVGYDTKGAHLEQTMTWKPNDKMTPKQIEKELNRQAVMFEEACLKGQVTAPVKFQDYAEEWFKQYAELKLKALTIQNYHWLEKRVYQEFGHIRMDKITPRHVQKFITDLTEAERNDRNGGKLSAKTIKLHLSFISTVFDNAVKMQIVSSNPCKNVTLPKMVQKERDIYTLEETQELINLLLHEEPEHMNFVVFFLLAIFTGFRRGELLGLEWKDFDFEYNTVSVRRTSNAKTGIGVFTDTPKTKTSNRTLKLSDDIMAIVQRFRVHQNEEKVKLGSKWIETDRLFTAWQGLPMHPNTPHKYFQRFCDRTGMRFVSCHNWRHLNASLLIANGIDVKTVQSCLGHSTPTTTLSIYCHAFQTAQARAMDVVSNCFSLKLAD